MPPDAERRRQGVGRPRHADEIEEIAEPLHLGGAVAAGEGRKLTGVQAISSASRAVSGARPIR